MGQQDYTAASDATFDGADTVIAVDESITQPSPGTIRLETYLTPAARAMHLTGGVMYYGNVRWPTRLPDVAYTESGSYDVRLQNEYQTSSSTIYGPVRELTGVGKVACGWHLETALHVYVKDGGTWKQYRRVVPSEQGLYLTEGSDYVSNYVFEADKWEEEGASSDKKVSPSATFIEEDHIVVESRVNRPLEITSNGFSLHDAEEVRALMTARLAEEEGLRTYDFYVGTDQSIYAVEPDPENETNRTLLVTQEFGVGVGKWGFPVHTSAPQSAVVLATNGTLRVLSGRREERLFPEGAVPWNEVYDLAYHIQWEELAIATDDGVWFFDWNRKGIFRQYDAFIAEGLAYDIDDGSLLGWDAANSVWKRFDGSGSQLSPSVTTQMIESGGREFELVWVKTDYEKGGYDNTDASTFAELWHTVRNDRALGYSQDPDGIQGTPEVNAGQNAGATTIPIATGVSESVTLSAGDYVIFENHDESYEVASDVSISASSTGSIELSYGLEEAVPSTTEIRVPYRGIVKIPAQERIQPPFRGKGHQVRLQNFDTLRDVQILARPRINYE